jgi:signal peptidase I
MNYNLDEILDGYDNESDIPEEEKRYQREEAEKEIKKTTGKDNFWKEVFSWVRIIVGAFIVAFLLSNFVIVNARVPSGSMISTINENDKVIGFRLAYLFSDPERGDIVMFDSPVEDKIYIKRIIGLPGETVEIRDNTVYINGQRLEEDYVKNEWTNSPGTKTYEVPKGCYFMMGDNRNASADSRVWGVVKEDAIIAKAIFRYYPSIDMLD